MRNIVIFSRDLIFDPKESSADEQQRVENDKTKVEVIFFQECKD